VVAFDLPIEVWRRHTQGMVCHRDFRVGGPGRPGWSDEKPEQQHEGDGTEAVVTHGDVLYGFGRPSATPLDYSRLPLVQSAVGALGPVPR